jgi:hypothetical protein
MTTGAIYELMHGSDFNEVKFTRDVNQRWHADVKLMDGTRWAFRQDTAGPFHPCEVHAERLVFAAKAMVNSGRPA